MQRRSGQSNVDKAVTQGTLQKSAADADHAVYVYSAKVLRLHCTHAANRSAAFQCREGHKQCGLVLWILKKSATSARRHECWSGVERAQRRISVKT